MRIGHKTVSRGITKAGVEGGKERGEGRLMCNTLKEEGSPSFFVRGLLTWGNICCIEIETDDSNYMQSEGLPA